MNIVSYYVNKAFFSSFFHVCFSPSGRCFVVHEPIVACFLFRPYQYFDSFQEFFLHVVFLYYFDNI